MRKRHLGFDVFPQCAEEWSVRNSRKKIRPGRFFEGTKVMRAARLSDSTRAICLKFMTNSIPMVFRVLAERVQPGPHITIVLAAISAGSIAEIVNIFLNERLF